VQARLGGCLDATVPVAAACPVPVQLPADARPSAMSAWDAWAAVHPAGVAGAVPELAVVAAERLAVPAPDVLAQVASSNPPLAELASQPALAAVPCTPGAAPFAGRSSWAAERPDGLARPSKPLGPRERSPLQVAQQRCRKPEELLEAEAALLAAEPHPAAHSPTGQASQPAEPQAAGAGELSEPEAARSAA